jgi:hypothetical protein
MSPKELVVLEIELSNIRKFLDVLGQRQDSIAEILKGQNEILRSMSQTLSGLSSSSLNSKNDKSSETIEVKSS